LLKIKRKAEQRERELAEEHLKMGEEARRARARNQETMYNAKRDLVQSVRQERQLHRVEVRTQQAEEFQQKRDKRAGVKKREDELRSIREQARAEAERANEEMYLKRVREKELETRRKEKQVSKMEKMEMQLIQKLKNTQQLQQRAFYELETALNGDV
jgi:hypothetical protein